VLPAFLTTILFSFSVIFAARSARLLGGATANLGRMLIATGFLAVWAFSVGKGIRGPSLGWFLASGAVGFGFGDIALFLALPRIGARLTILLAQCLAAPFGALIEWVWLGTIVSGAQLLCGLVILLGVVIAVAPERRVRASRGELSLGVAAGVCAGFGQALGAVFSRKGYAIADAAQFAIDGGSTAFQRMLGGIVVTLLFFLAVKISRGRESPSRPPARAWRWVVLNSLAGPTLGVGCYQWALSQTPSAIVLPIVATTPVVTIPLAYLIDGEVPAVRSIAGGLIAVAGSIMLSVM
jgi:drug/metabolite transporter (DMT)-like permease